jgi:hypothetical protein
MRDVESPQWNLSRLSHYLNQSSDVDQNLWQIVEQVIDLLYWTKKPTVYRRDMVLFSVFSPITGQVYDNCPPPLQTQYIGAKLVITFCLQGHRYYNAERKASIRHRYMGRQVYYWTAHYDQREDTYAPVEEKYLTISLSMQEVNQAHIDDLLRNNLRTLFCALGLVVHSLFSSRIASVLIPLDFYSPAAIKAAVNTLALNRVLMQVRQDSCDTLFRSQPFECWPYNEDLLRSHPNLLFPYMYTPKVLFYILSYYLHNGPLPAPCARYLKHTDLIPNLKAALVSLSQVLVDSSFVYSLNPDGDWSDISTTDGRNPSVRNEEDSYRRLLVLPLFLRMDGALLSLLLRANDSVQVIMLLNALYDNLVVYLRAQSTDISSILSRLTSVSVMAINERIGNGQGIDGNPLIRWNDMVAACRGL